MAEAATASRPSAPELVALAGFIGVCLIAAALGAMATTPEVAGWYRHLNKPSWTPPDAAFGVVWTILYVVMGVAAWIVWRRCAHTHARSGLLWFGVQLALNVGWSWLFFASHQVAWAFGELLLLWLAIAITARLFHLVSPAAGWLMAPYLAWTTFAAMLNGAILFMN
ncbi:MAG: tryptophan-rich sensory protein [Planctomycetales bacterium]|nr:tryptophan-rich sensory protein [Planctomycetales bacterium]